VAAAALPITPMAQGFRDAATNVEGDTARGGRADYSAGVASVRPITAGSRTVKVEPWL
jgi:hypothetical protein